MSRRCAICFITSEQGQAGAVAHMRGIALMRIALTVPAQSHGHISNCINPAQPSRHALISHACSACKEAACFASLPTKVAHHAACSPMCWPAGRRLTRRCSARPRWSAPLARRRARARTYLGWRTWCAPHWPLLCWRDCAGETQNGNGARVIAYPRAACRGGGLGGMGYALCREHSAKPFHLRLADDCKCTKQSTHM